MGFQIQTNIAAMTAHRNATLNNVRLDKSLASLSSGLRINKAADDASGLSIANKLSAQSLGLEQAVRNANDGIGLVQTADGALEEYTNILNRVRVLSVQSANDTQDTDSRSYIQKEVNTLLAQADKIATSTTYNDIPLLDGTVGSTNTLTTAQIATGTGIDEMTAYIISNFNASSDYIDARFSVVSNTADANRSATANNPSATSTVFSDFENDLDSAASTVAVPGATAADILAAIQGVINTYNTNHPTSSGSGGSSFTFHTGAYSANTQSLSIASMRTSDIVGTIDVTSQTAAGVSITKIDTALTNVTKQRAALGASQNRLESTIRNNSTTQVNVASAQSQLRDVDFAQESSNFSKHNIIAQSGSYAMSQANAKPQSVMRILESAS